MENEILRRIFVVVSHFPLHFVLYLGNLDYFLDSALPVADIDADATHDEVDELVDLGVKVRPVVNDIHVGVVPPRLHGPPVPFPRQLQSLEPDGG